MGFSFPLIEKSLLDDILTLSHNMKNLRCSEVPRPAQVWTVVCVRAKMPAEED